MGVNRTKMQRPAGRFLRAGENPIIIWNDNDDDDSDNNGDGEGDEYKSLFATLPGEHCMTAWKTAAYSPYNTYSHYNF